jgi:UDP-GlcNAc3NAcA epimerase
MNIISVIGTRPQYIKVKPIQTYCINNNIKHFIIDTNQHYSDNVSKNIINDLNLKIDFNLNKNNNFNSEIDFIYQTSKNFINLINNYFKNEKIYIIVYGDTNSSFSIALTCHKNMIPFAHVEAGVRCGDNTVPEEVNRIYTDTVANLNFCSSISSCKNIKNGILSGDLEYELLQSLNLDFNDLNYGVLTIHRQENLNNYKLNKIFNYLNNFNKIIFPIHHRLKNHEFIINKNIPNNIEIIEPLPFTKMAQLISSSSFVFTDSGGILRTLPFYGKKSLILRSSLGWKEVVENGYAKICEYNNDDIKWINNLDINRKLNFYTYNLKPSSIIINEILNKNAN